MPPSCRVRRSITISSPYAPLLDGPGRQPGGSNGTSPDPGEDGISSPPLQRGPGSSTRFGSGTRPRSRTLASIFGELSSSTRRREVSPGSGPRQPQSLNEQEGAGIVRRPGGLVTGHFLSRRSQIPLHAPVSDRADSSHLSEVAAHGSQLDVLVPNESEPGLVGSALSHLSNVEDMHHDDEIVEHLEVIDPHVAAVSHLSNAANSILIPPMSLYSRRPVIRLPHSQSITPQDLLEKGGRHHMDDLDRHVEHVLTRRDKVRRTAAGIWAFVKTPMGVIAAFYGFCVVFWGAAIVFFLANWVPTGSKDRQGFWVEVSSQVENALFTVTGIGLIPWRVVDTYRILWIWNYKRLTRKLRREAGLPELYDVDDLPDPAFDPNYVHVLTDKQQEDLHHQQKEFAKSQTWYRPHGTETHRAFPIAMALLICLFVDGNSVFQIILCGTMWGLNRFQRPAWSTGILIPLSFLCGIVAAILIWKGGQNTKRTKVVEARLRAALDVEQRTGVPAAIIPVASHASTTSINSRVANASQREPSSPDIEKMMIPESVEPAEGTEGRTR